MTKCQYLSLNVTFLFNKKPDKIVLQSYRVNLKYLQSKTKT